MSLSLPIRELDFALRGRGEGWRSTDQSQASVRSGGRSLTADPVKAYESGSIGWQSVQGCDRDRPMNPGLHFFTHTHTHTLREVDGCSKIMP